MTIDPAISGAQPSSSAHSSTTAVVARRGSMFRGRIGRLGRIAVVAAIGAMLFGLGAGVASAHVTVNPGEVASGSWAKLTFRVPTESATASTVALQVLLPTDHPFPNVSVMPVPGWAVTPSVKKLDPPVVQGKFTLTEATSSVTWAAQDGNGIAPGEFQEFSISVGPIPDVASMVLPAIQTYSDGSIVEWKGVAAPGADTHSLDHPAPVLTITNAAAPADAHAAPPAPPAADTTAQILGGAALLIAAIALVFAVLSWRRGSTGRTRYDASLAASGANPGGTDASTGALGDDAAKEQ
ncbi:MAG: YcnI family protein [Nakamurella sp.]